MSNLRWDKIEQQDVISQILIIRAYYFSALVRNKPDLAADFIASKEYLKLARERLFPFLKDANGTGQALMDRLALCPRTKGLKKP